MSQLSDRTRGWPWYGWLGLLLAAVFWGLNWGLDGLRTHWGFFPLWLGFCLTIDALTVWQKGSSLLKRNPKAYLALFLISAPAWWLFEVLNWRTQNWYYDGRVFFSHAEYFLLASLSFSTVMPAVFGAAELLSSLPWFPRTVRGPRIPPTRTVTTIFFAAGWLMLLALLIWPKLFFPFLWISLYFILAPLNIWLGRRSLSEFTAHREWRPVLALWGGVLLCALFWEMWNYFSYPKWIYQIPYLNVLPIFEMPFFGYFGYLPFSLELYALYQLVAGIGLPAAWRAEIQLMPEAQRESMTP